MIFVVLASDSVILDLFREMTVPFGDPPAVGGGKKGDADFLVR